MNQRKFHTRWVESSSPFFEHHEFPDVFSQPFLSFKPKAKRTECKVEKKTVRIFRRKFTDGEAQVKEFVDDKTKIYFIGAAQKVALFLLARKEWLRKQRECGGWTRQCSHTNLGTDAEHGSLSNGTLSRVEIGTDPRRKYLETGTKQWRRKFLETRAKEREFALDMPLEIEAECRHIHQKINLVPRRALCIITWEKFYGIGRSLKSVKELGPTKTNI